MNSKTIILTLPDDAVPRRGQDGDGGGAAAGRPRQAKVDLQGEALVAVGVLGSLEEDGTSIDKTVISTKL